MKKILLIPALAATMAVTTPAFAGGFLGDIVEGVCGNCGLGRAGDQWNAQNGQIVDHGIAAGMNYFVPGSGAALEAGWAAQRAYNQAQQQYQQYQQNPYQAYQQYYPTYTPY